MFRRAQPQFLPVDLPVEILAEFVVGHYSSSLLLSHIIQVLVEKLIAWAQVTCWHRQLLFASLALTTALLLLEVGYLLLHVGLYTCKAMQGI